MAYHSPFFVSLDQGMAKLERVFNGFGYIPVLSSFTGPIRAAIGKVEIVAALIIGAIVLIVTWRFDRAVDVVLNYALNGVANVIRGWIEFVPIIGNYLCYTYDTIGRMPYTYEDPLYARLL